MADSTFHRMAIAGSHKVIRGFLAGAMSAAGTSTDVIYCLEREIEAESLGQQIMSWVGGADETFVVLTGAQRKVFEDALKRLPDDFPMKIASDKEIGSATFTFEFEVFAKPYADKILELFKNLPSSVSIDGFDPKETIDPEAKGIESYAPAHHYTLEGKGKVKGPVDEILALHYRCQRTDLIEESEIELTLKA